jgi:hypothetical protein
MKRYSIQKINTFNSEFSTIIGFEQMPKSYSEGAWRMLRAFYGLESHFRYVQVDLKGNVLDVVDEWKSPKVKTSTTNL